MVLKCTVFIAPYYQFIKQYCKCSKISNTFTFLFSNQIFPIRVRIHKMLIRISNREDPGLIWISSGCLQLFKILEHLPYVKVVLGKKMVRKQMFTLISVNSIAFRLTKSLWRFGHSGYRKVQNTKHLN